MPGRKERMAKTLPDTSSDENEGSDNLVLSHQSQEKPGTSSQISNVSQSGGADGDKDPIYTLKNVGFRILGKSFSFTTFSITLFKLLIDFSKKKEDKPMNIKMEFTLPGNIIKIVGKWALDIMSLKKLLQSKHQMFGTFAL